MTRRSGRFVRRHSKAGSGTATSTTRTATQTPRRRRSSVLKRIASSGWTGRGRRALRRVGLATYKSRARSTPSPLSWHLTESLRSVSPSEVGAPGGIRTPNLLIRRPRPSVRTGPASQPSRSEPQTWSPWMSVVVRGWPRGLAPRMAPGSRSCSLIRSRSHALRVGSVASMSDCAAKSCPRTCAAVHGLPVCRLLDSPHAETVTPRTPAG